MRNPAIAHHGILYQMRDVERGALVTGIFPNAVDTLVHVFQQDPVCLVPGITKAVPLSARAREAQDGGRAR